MATKVFINLSVENLDKSIDFFTRLGFSFNPQFTDENAACMIIAENIFVMLILKNRFRDFTKKEICNAKEFTEVLIAIDAESRDKVDEMIKTAIASGGSVYSEPQDHGWMYTHSFADPDGHQWEVLFMEQKAIDKG